MKVVRIRAFTLIEMLVVVLIMSLLASAAWPLAKISRQRAREAELRQELRAIRGAIDAYKIAWDAGRIEHKTDATGYPPSLEALVEGAPDVTDPTGRRLYFLRRLPRDPLADSRLDAAQTWALRSYGSPPDAPAAGDDVFDVSSRMTGIGLDGIPYARW